MINKFEFLGAESGINVLILGAIHGNEIAGPKAISRLISEIESGKIKLLKGKLVLVPVCNVDANKKDVRSIDENLNRVITKHENPATYEQKLANKICPLIEDCDIMLDLHSTHCEGDVPFAFCDYPSVENQKLIDVLPVKYVLEGWPQIYDGQGEINDFSTERYAHLCGNVGTTLECGYHKADDAGNVAYEAIINMLNKFGLVATKDSQTYEKTHILMKNYVIKKREGKLCKNFKHLDCIKKGELIARYDDGEELYALDDGFILLPNLCAEIGAEWYYFGVEK